MTTTELLIMAGLALAAYLGAVLLATRRLGRPAHVWVAEHRDEHDDRRIEAIFRTRTEALAWRKRHYRSWIPHPTIKQRWVSSTQPPREEIDLYALGFSERAP